MKWIRISISTAQLAQYIVLATASDMYVSRNRRTGRADDSVINFHGSHVTGELALSVLGDCSLVRFNCPASD